MSREHLMEAQQHTFQAYEHLALATEARQLGRTVSHYHAAMSAAHSGLASLALTASAQAA